MRHGFTNEMLDMEQNGTVLKRIDAMGSAECWWCGDAGRSVMHLYTKLHQLSKVADRTPILEKESDHRYLVAMTTREKVASRATGKRTTQWCRYFSF